MSVKVHEPVCLDSVQDKFFWSDHFLGDQLKDEWSTAGTGTTAVIDQQTGGIIRLISGAVTGNNRYIDWANIRIFLVSKKVTMEVRAKKASATLQTVRMELNFGVLDRIMFLINQGLGETNWQLFVREGGASTQVDSGIAVDTDWHVFRIECFLTGQVHFYIDEVECGNSPVTTNIPPDHLQPRFESETDENAAKTLDIDYVVVRQER